MKRLGLVGGITWQATMAYYQTIQGHVAAHLGALHSAHVSINSLDFAEFVALQEADDWDGVAELLINAARELAAGGAEAFMICCNTVHKVAPTVASEAGIPLIHIADSLASAIKRQGLSKVGLMGTIYTMGEDFYRGYLQREFGIEVVLPSNDEQRFINDIIFDELGVGKIEDSSRQQYLECIDHLADDGAQGVVLGCTEIPLLISQDDTDVPVFDTAYIHALAGAEWMLDESGPS